MIYFDYSATTQTNEAVLSRFVDVSSRVFANPNSQHMLGTVANQLVVDATNSIKKSLHCPNHEVIFTSGATESNNLAIKGICKSAEHVGKHIITTAYEHPSVIACISLLQSLGYEIDIVGLLPNGTLDLIELKELLRQDTVLVSISAVFSELGFVQPIQEISKIIHQYSNAVFHSDITQAVGKVHIPYGFIDFMSLSAHKFYGIKGVGALLKRSDLPCTPQIIGGSSTTKYRSGTPSVVLIDSMATALQIQLEDLSSKMKHVEGISGTFINRLQKNPSVRFNRTSECIPHIVNVSFFGQPSLMMQQKLSTRGIYVSFQTACKVNEEVSTAVLRFTKDNQLASTSLRFSFSHLTTQDEIDESILVIEELLK
jgi:cysteine desulfurase